MQLVLAGALLACPAVTALADDAPRPIGEVPKRESPPKKSDEKTDRVTLRPKDSKDAKDPKKDAPPTEDGWVELATPTPAKHGTEFISVDPSSGAFATLRLEATSGNVVVDRITVTFQDGTTKAFPRRQWLGPKKPSMFVELGAAKAIQRIVVVTDRHPNGSYAIFGAPTSEVATR
jgi:hypothetical protein